MTQGEVSDWADEGVLRGVLRHLRTDLFGALPPVDIPQSVIDSVDDTGKNRALWRHRQRVRQAGTDEAGAEAPEGTVEAALALIEQMDTRAVTAFKQRLQRLDPGAHGGQHYNRPGSYDSAQEVERIRELAADAAAASAALAEARTTVAASGKPRARAAASRARALIDQIEPVLADYHRFEVQLADAAMRARRADCELEARRRRDLREQIDGLETRLEKATSRWRRLMRRGVVADDPARLAKRLEALKEERDKPAEFVDEHQLRGWLEAIVNACFYSPFETWAHDTRDTRLILYQLLNVYCFYHLMEDDKRAIDTLLHHDARNTMRYCSKGEQYLTSYFAGRRPTDTSLERRFAGTDKEAHLTRAREAILAEYASTTAMTAAPPAR